MQPKLFKNVIFTIRATSDIGLYVIFDERRNQYRTVEIDRGNRTHTNVEYKPH